MGNDKVNTLSLKWGTLKSWDFESEECRSLLEEYQSLGSSMSSALQKDSHRQKEIICELIDRCDGDIYLAWDGEYVSKEKAKDYVINYGS